ncbi:MAG: spore coat protein CotJB [Ruminococcaceae bacterium]|nr:spore coat protein CotJB [Oscillospiraceae bacterium]
MDARSALLKEIQAEDFALYETALYLNGHPTCRSALSYYCQHKNTVKALRERYEELYGPLTLYGNSSESCWHWVDAPWPWEKEGN